MRRFGRTIVTAALAVSVVTGTAGWAAAGGSRRAVTGPPPGAAAWRAGTGLGRALPDPADADPHEAARFAAGLDAVGAPGPVLPCHSYGSVVCGPAARHTDAGDLVAFGSPGMCAGTAAGLGTKARVWAARGPSDRIADVPNVRFAGLGQGADPVPAAFGARRVPAADAAGHTGYFASGSQSPAAIAAIAKGEVR
ncbi:alpha/beta hydrolase [Streptomyces sp. NPDC006656]|uniref:alpha/beta hydrolase n=1 Tax=Streptomyces sp. NPDC006656 TaxID=3156899 RepID=UPI0034530F9A